jgi:hypothetical protein
MSKRGIFTVTGALAILIAAVLIFSALGGATAQAARGGSGGGKGGGKGGGANATLVITPSQVPLGGANVTISGSGFAANQSLILNTSMFPQPRVVTDASGAFSIVYSPEGGFSYPGPASVQALRASDLRVLATGSYTVCSSNPC